MTSPGEPRATSGLAEGLQALANWPGEVQGGRGGAWGRPRSATLALGSCSGCAPLALRR